MKKFYITEQERIQILSQHGLLNEQAGAAEEIKQGVGTDPYQYKKEGNKFFYAYKSAGSKPEWTQSKILKGVNAISQNIFGGGKVAENQDDLNKLYAQETQSNVTTTTTTIASGAGSGLSGTGSAGAAAGGGTSTTTSQVKGQTDQKQYAGGPSLDPDAYEKFQKENPQPTSTQPSATNQGQNVNKYNYPRPYLNQTTSQQPVQYGIKDLKDLLKQKGFRVGSDEDKLGRMTLDAIEKALSSK